MGENDPGASNGSPVLSSVDTIASNNLVFATNSTYSSDVTPIAVTRVNSSLSVNLTNQSYALAGTIVTNATDHFGIEAWVKPMVVNGTAQVIMYNGNTGTSGWGIFLDANNNYSGLFGGAAIITGVAAPHRRVGGCRFGAQQSEYGSLHQRRGGGDQQHLSAGSSGGRFCHRDAAPESDR